MKKKILISVLSLCSLAVFAQHNDNQKKFRSKQYAPSSLNGLYYNEENGFDVQGYNSNNLRQQNQSVYNGGLASNEMILDCSVLMNVKADSYLAIFNLTQVGSTAKEVDDLLNTRIASFSKGMAALDIQAQDIHVDMIYLIPVFEYEMEKRLFSKTYNEVPKGFEMQKNLHIRFKRSDLVDDLVTLAAANEIYDLVTVEYFIKDSKALYDTMRAQAINYIAQNVAKYKKLGLNLDGEFRVVSEVNKMIYPESQYDDYESFVSQSLDAAKNKTVTTMRKPKTVAYNKLPYNAFDLVINPEFLEPVVQLTYKLQVKYVLNKEKLEPKNNYFIIDANGNVKPLAIPNK